VLNHRKVVALYRKANNYTAQIAAIYGSGTDTMGVLAQAAILLIGGDMVLHHHLTVGELTAYVLYLNSLFLPVQQLVAIYNNYQQGTAAVVKIRDFLSTAPAVREVPDAITATDIRGELEFRDVDFGYDPRQPVISDVNLTIGAGETVAFVGPTGAGKSTLAKLVTRFYDPTRGAVLLDGQDIRELSLESLRRQLGVVPQEPFLFAGTLKDNVTFGRPDATDEEVRDTVRAIGLAPIVARLDGGLDAYLHERGQSLSSGERQLIALARAFLVQPKVLVLDEATSNLDREAEEQVEAALDTLLEDRAGGRSGPDGRSVGAGWPGEHGRRKTAILIAHRLSTAMRADRIVVVADGGIAETGSHDELLRAGGRYAQMYATWVTHSRNGVAGTR
jgi:ATP-binding cassette, subfamily B, bacterial